MVLGLDISTSVIGAAVLDDDGHLKRTLHCDLSRVGEKGYRGLFEKIALSEEFIEDLAWDERCDEMLDFPAHPKVKIFVEDRLSNFASGRTMLQTLLKLASFNLVVSWHAYQAFLVEADVQMEHIHPSTVKSLMQKEGLIIPKGSKDKKKLTLEFVARREPKFVVKRNKKGNPQPFMYDEADAYITALAGVRKFVQS